MRNRMISGTGSIALVIGLILTLAGCVVETGYGPGYYHPYHVGYYGYYR
jgi:hypothetical protein